MASLSSMRSKVVGATVGAAAAGAMALLLASPAHAVYGCEDLQSGGTACSQTFIPTTTTTTTTTPTTLGAVVKGETVEATPAAVAPAAVESDTLPFTGVEVGGLVVLGGGLIAGGVFLSMAARRKAQDPS